MFSKLWGSIRQALLAFALLAPAGLMAATESPPPAGGSAAGEPTLAMLYQLLLQQQHEIEALKAKLAVIEAPVDETAPVKPRDEELYAIVEAQQDEIEALKSDAAEPSRTTIGGYGELHYNNLNNQRGGDDIDQVDFHRFVLFFGHQFNERTRFYSELELEHSFVEDTADGSGPGEVELEQAFVEYDLTERHHVTAGLQLLPVGILNKTHEPPTFFGVERNPVETNIIPTTWWEAGLGFHGELVPDSGLSYEVMLHSGLDTPETGGSAFLPRSGRQKVARAPADDGAVTAQLAWRGLPGLELAVSGQYQSDITQGGSNISALFGEAHVDYRRGPFGLRALYARWELDDGLPGEGPAGGPSLGRDQQYGWYVEPSWRLPRYSFGEIGFFARYHEWNNNAGDDAASKRKQYNFGLNYWLLPNVVFKFDYEEQDNPDSLSEFDGFNLGVGYSF